MIDLKALGSKKALIYGVPAAGALGLGVWYYRKNHPAAAASSAVTDTTDAGAVPSGSAAGSFPDTSGTDVASWLGGQEGQLQDEFNSYLTESAAQNQAFLDQLGTPAAPPPTTPIAPPGSPAPPVAVPKAPPGTPVGHPAAPQPKRQVPVVAFNSKSPAWDSTLSGIAAHEHTTVAALEKLNGNVDPRKLRVGQEINY